MQLQLLKRRYLTFALVVVTFAITSHAQQSQNLPLKAGTYQCVTVSVSSSATPSRQRDDPVVVARRGERQQGEVTMQEIKPPQLFFGPAAFGNVILDDKGGYRMPAVRQTGKYGFNTATGRPTFTGDLGAMLKNDYDGSGMRFRLALGDMNFQCGLTGAPTGGTVGDNAVVGPLPAVAQDPQAALAASSGAILKTATAADFKGHFSGSYFCGQSETSMLLDLAATADGSITAVMQFGANSSRTTNYIVGSYALKGTWKGSHFTLRSQQWIKQPDGYVMVDLEGDLTALGASGKVLLSQCSVFAVERVQK